MVKRVFGYLKGTRTLGLTYLGKTNDVQAFSDASFADCRNSLTTSGFVVKLYGDSVAWRTRKQNYVALSTCQAEFVSMSDACQELMSLNNSLTLIFINNFFLMKLWCDNKAAASSAKVSESNKLRHMPDVKEHYVRECVDRGFAKVLWIRSRDQIAEVFMPLTSNLHDYLTNLMMNTESRKK